MNYTLAWSATWAGTKVRVTLTQGTEVLFVDAVDPVGAESRRRLLDRIAEKFPAADRQPIEARLLEMATAGPPKAEETTFAIPPNPPAWDEHVPGDQLLGEIAALLTRHVVLPECAADAIALWVVSTFVFDRFAYSPRLLVSSPDKRCGKSLLLRFVAALSARPLTCENISAAALYRSVEKFQPTLLLDEADTFLSGKNVNEDLRGVVNAGFARGGCVLRCVGDDSEPMPFRVFGPLALGMIGKPPGTIEDRSIAILMRRKLKGEQVVKLPPGRLVRDVLLPTVRKIVRWTADHADALATATPQVPPDLDDRAGDCWFPLLAIADAAGGDWSVRARRAAMVLAAGRDAIDSLGLMLLADLRAIFTEQTVERLKTETILRLLAQKEDRPWPDYRRGKAINARQLARLLEPFDIEPRQFKLPEGVQRGYAVADMADAWSRYLPESAQTGLQSATAATTLNGNGLGHVRPATSSDAVADGRATSGRTGSGVAAGSGSGAAEVADGSRCQESSVAAVAERRQEKPLDPMTQLRRLVEDMSDDLDAMPDGAVPFRGCALREHYREAVRLRGVVHALADANERYRAQVAGTVLPLHQEVESW